MKSSEQVIRIEDIIKKKAPLTKTIFIGILFLPPTLSAMLFAWVSGYTPAENNVIILIIITIVYSIIYAFIYLFKKKLPNWLFHLFRIKENRLDLISAENVFFNNDFIFKDGKKDIQLSPLDRERIVLLSINICKMKLINRLGITMTFITVLTIGFFG
ncbi:MAG: hypothetical protein K9L64_05940 [Candidatus Izimaplasma sp.]|nr:hypothetical protein [Candidatus Izimaplasma bacterium]